jgi:hypothetical protein
MEKAKINDEKTKKSKSERCKLCKKKLKMMSFTCKCGLNFCVAHQNPHSHNCSYDYKSEKCKIIKDNNPKLGSKLTKI